MSSNRNLSFPRTGNGYAFCETCGTFADWNGCSHGPITDAELNAHRSRCQCPDGGWIVDGYCTRCHLSFGDRQFWSPHAE